MQGVTWLNNELTRVAVCDILRQRLERQVVGAQVQFSRESRPPLLTSQRRAFRIVLYLLDVFRESGGVIWQLPKLST